MIPRGGDGLKEALKEHATVPVIYAAGGNGHVFVDASADLDDAVAIAVNVKVQRPSTCNAAETLLVHADRGGRVPAASSRRSCASRGWSCGWTDGHGRWPSPLADSLAEAGEADATTEYALISP